MQRFRYRCLMGVSVTSACTMLAGMPALAAEIEPAARPLTQQASGTSAVHLRGIIVTGVRGNLRSAQALQRIPGL